MTNNVPFFAILTPKWIHLVNFCIIFPRNVTALSENRVFLSNLSHQRDRTVLYRAVQYRVVQYRAVQYRYFAKIPIHSKVTFFTHRCRQRFIAKYAVTSIVTLNCNVKHDRDTYRYRYYRYRTLKNKASAFTITFTVTFAVTDKNVNLYCDGKSNGKSNDPGHASLKM